MNVNVSRKLVGKRRKFRWQLEGKSGSSKTYLINGSVDDLPSSAELGV